MGIGYGMLRLSYTNLFCDVLHDQYKVTCRIYFVFARHCLVGTSVANLFFHHL